MSPSSHVKKECWPLFLSPVGGNLYGYHLEVHGLL